MLDQEIEDAENKLIKAQKEEMKEKSSKTDVLKEIIEFWKRATVISLEKRNLLRKSEDNSPTIKYSRSQTLNRKKFKSTFSYRVSPLSSER